MRKLIINEWLSLDGYVSDKTGGLDFFVKHVRSSYNTPGRLELLNSLDSILFGRKTYEQFSALWPDRPVEDDLLAKKINTLNKTVFTNSLQDAPWGQWPKAAVETGDALANIKAMKALPGKNMILWGSITLAQAVMKAGLADEYHLHICPVLTGGGRKFFMDDVKPALTFLGSQADSEGVVLLRYSAI